MFPKKCAVSVCLAALAAPWAAQAQSSYNMFGVLDLSVGSIQLSANGGAKRVTSVDSGQMVTSQIGFRGVEDMGGGMKAGFLLISFLRADTGASGRINGPTGIPDVFWGKAANVYLDSPYGKLTLGRQTDLLFLNVLSYNPFVDSFGLSPAVRLTFGRWGNDKGDSGVSNAITYQTPNYSGVTVAAQYQAGESASGAEDDSFGVTVSYTAGPFSASGSLQVLKSAEAPKPDFVSGQQQSFGMLSASYDFGVLKLFGQFGEIKNSGVALTGTTPRKTNIYLLSASVPVTPKGKVLMSFGESVEKTPDMKHSILTLAYDHYLSKRTDVYAAYMLDDEKAPGWKSGSSVVLGLRHAF